MKGPTLKEFAERLARLEALLLPGIMKVSEAGAEWIRDPYQLKIKRCWPDQPGVAVNIFDENACEIYLEKTGPFKPRLVARMDRGIVLYAEYLPIYKDVIAMLEKVQAELTAGVLEDVPK